MNDKRINLRNRIQGHNLTYSWVIVNLRALGVEVDKSSLSSIMSGVIVGERATRVIDAANQLLDDYETCFLQRCK